MLYLLINMCGIHYYLFWPLHIFKLLFLDFQTWQHSFTVLRLKNISTTAESDFWSSVRACSNSCEDSQEKIHHVCNGTSAIFRPRNLVWYSEPQTWFDISTQKLGAIFRPRNLTIQGRHIAPSFWVKISHQVPGSEYRTKIWVGISHQPRPQQNHVFSMYTRI